MNALEERRQRAREAFEDRWSIRRDTVPYTAPEHEGWAERLLAARDEAIETATRVRITDELVRTAMDATDGPIYLDETRAALKATLIALGFEVEA